MATTWERHELVRVMAMGIGPDTEVCYNCTHFHTHYSKDGALICSGHCAYPRLKERRLWDTCGKFEHKDAPSGAANT